MSIRQDTASPAQAVPEPRDEFSSRGVSGPWASSRRFRPILAITMLLYVLLALTQKGFFTNTNMENLALGATVLFIVAMGMTFVVLSGGFDLSVGATAALSGYLMAKLLGLSVPPVAAMACAVVFGGALGGVTNGVLIGKFGLSFFVVTLATMTTFTGIADLWSGTITITITNPTVIGLSTGHFLGLPNVFWLMLAVFLILLYIQHRTYFGRDTMAVGGSRVAARLSGVKTGRTLIVVYALAGCTAALGGIVQASQIGGATPTPDNTLPLQAAAAVLLGGTSIAGGAGGLGGTVAGVFFIATLENGLSVANVASYWQQILTGVILVVAVAGDVARSGRGNTLRERFAFALSRYTRRSPEAISEPQTECAAERARLPVGDRPDRDA